MEEGIGPKDILSYDSLLVAGSEEYILAAFAVNVKPLRFDMESPQTNVVIGAVRMTHNQTRELIEGLTAILGSYTEVQK